MLCSPLQPGRYNIRLVEHFAVLVNTVDIVVLPDIEVLIAVGRGVVVTVRGDDNPLAFGKTDKLGDFLTG